MPMGMLARLMGWADTSSITSTYAWNLGDTYTASTSAREQLPAVVRGITLLASDIARIGVRIRDRAGSTADHPVITLLRDAANPHMSGGAWRSWMVSTALLHGTAYSFVQRDSVGEAIALWPVAPSRVSCEWSGYAPGYWLDGQAVDQHTLISLMAGPGSASNPYTCVSPLTRCAPSLSLAVLHERVATALAQAGRVGKVSITHPGTLSTTAKLDLLDAYTRKHISPEAAARPLVLDEGVKVDRVGDGSAAGLIDDRRYSVIEVARALGIPPQMLYQGDAGSLTSQVEMQRQYVDGTVSAWCDRFAAQLSMRLLPESLQIELLARDLTRGNLRDTASALKDLSFTGALIVDDAREMLGLSRSAIHGAEVVRKLSGSVEVDT